MGRKASALKLDASDTGTFVDFAESVKAAHKDNWGRDSFDYLVNNAGIGISAPFSETTEEQFDALMNIHLKGVFFLTQKLLPLIADGGRIVNVSTGLCFYEGRCRGTNAVSGKGAGSASDRR